MITPSRIWGGREDEEQKGIDCARNYYLTREGSVVEIISLCSPALGGFGELRPRLIIPNKFLKHIIRFLSKYLGPAYEVSSEVNKPANKEENNYLAASFNFGHFLNY